MGEDDRRREADHVINNTLAALDDFYLRRGMGKAAARRESRAAGAQGADHREALRYLRAVEQPTSPRNRAIALLPYYAGLRIGEVVGLDVDDVRLSARKGQLRNLGKGRDGGKLAPSPSTPTCGRPCKPGSASAAPSS